MKRRESQNKMRIRAFPVSLHLKGHNLNWTNFGHHMNLSCMLCQLITIAVVAFVIILHVLYSRWNLLFLITEGKHMFESNIKKIRAAPVSIVLDLYWWLQKVYGYHNINRNLHKGKDVSRKDLFNSNYKEARSIFVIWKKQTLFHLVS